jgi:hypothetical protein
MPSGASEYSVDVDAVRALDSVDRFIAVGRELAGQQSLSKPQYSGAVEQLIEVIQILLSANENMARWLNRFTQFDFRAPKSRQKFLRLVARYRKAKSGPDLRRMKWPCHEIRTIYENDIQPSMSEMFVQTEAIPEELDAAFQGLGNADDDMVAFIYETVVGGIDGFLATAEPAVDHGDLDAAEHARLEFKAQARQLSERLERLGGGLTELLLGYARLAGISVRLPS